MKSWLVVLCLRNTNRVYDTKVKYGAENSKSAGVDSAVLVAHKVNEIRIVVPRTLLSLLAV